MHSFVNMNFITGFYISLLLGLTAVSAFKPQQSKNTTLGPVAAPNYNTSDPKHFVPSRQVNLHYASNITGNTISSANISLFMRYPAIVLENVASIASVECSASSLAIKFSTKDGYQKAVAQWGSKTNLLMVTNHFGNCDAEYERGLFVVESLKWSPNTLLVTASSSKSDIASVAEEAELTFGKQAATSSFDKRFVYDPSYTISAAYALPSDITLFSDAPYFAVTADTASFSADIVFSGYLKYSFLFFELKDLYFDIDTTFGANLDISATITSAYNTNLTYTPNPLTYDVIDIPGILTIGPEVIFGISADVTLSEAVDISTTLGISLADGNAHLDALHSSKSGFSGWTPTYTAFTNISANAAATFNPEVSLTVELAISILGGLVDLSTGLTAKPGFKNNFVVSGDEGINWKGLSTVTPATAVGCENGLELKSDFTFELDAFVTQYYKTVLFTTDIPLVNECYSWAG